MSLSSFFKISSSQTAAVKKVNEETPECKEQLAFQTGIPKDYQALIHAVLAKNTVHSLEQKVNHEYNTGTIFPPRDKIFRALELCPLDKVRVVILGQDPYHTPGQANGLCFSCETQPLQPSLRNIFEQVQKDTGKGMSATLLTGNLEPWAKQGVLLLNTTLTVKMNKANSHKDLGWNEVTKGIVSELSRKKKGLVFLLWGKHAHDVGNDAIVNPGNHLVLKSSHPSPYSYTTSSSRVPSFSGCQHFSLCNQYLEKHSKGPVNWN
jgi:uracil-DNA glycosylase